MRRRAAPWYSVALGLTACIFACSTSTTPVGGLLVVMSIEPSLSDEHPDALTVVLSSVEGGATYKASSYPVDDAMAPGNTQFPTSIGIDSNGDPNAVVSIDLAISADGTTLDHQTYWVTHVPATTVVELPVVFGSSCGEAGESDAATACPLEAWGCMWSADHWVCDGAGLPAPGLDASWPSPSVRSADEAGQRPPADATLDAAGPKEPPAADGPANGSDANEGVDATVNGFADAAFQAACDAPCALGQHCVSSTCVALPASCTGGGGAGFNCGVTGMDDCCASDEVRGGAFWRDYDGHLYSDMSHPATVSSFLLDRYEVTVGRFRQFVGSASSADASPAWTPESGAGKHTHLNNGMGLSSGGDGAVLYESGWDAAWNMYLPATLSGWEGALGGPCGSDSGSSTGTWTPSPDGNENRPITCVTWFAAYAFCIWDGGFLPSIAEWDYAASGGGNQWEYAWGNSPPGPGIAFAIWNCFYPQRAYNNNCTGVANIAPVGSVPAGRGAWGQLDLTGNAFEWTLDYADAYPLPCLDCAETSSGIDREVRGGAFDSPYPQDVLNSARVDSPPSVTQPEIGFRCARTP